MKKIFYATALFFIVSCNNPGNSNHSADSTISKGNSPGSNIMEMDTGHLDTSVDTVSSHPTNH